MSKIIMLHGWTKNPDKWQTFLSILKTKGINAEFPKVPGPTGDLDKVWKLENYIQWLKNITDKEKDKVILIGQSNGGRISLAFTNLFPQKVEKLILIDSAGIYHNELPLRIKRIVFKTIAKIGKKLTSSKSMKDLLYKFARESDYKDLDKNAKQTMINLLNSDKDLNISQLSTPTLIIWGTNDKTTPLSDGLLMNSLIQNSKLKIIKDAGHSPQYTNPLEIVSLISDFIKS
ncbi:MAG: alpha/beta hydrolase fold protein [Candidatus Levybacteria bacterium]|nr:alpha/beta hydrolase fold protein [Candidatus Levybacteria bacterium]